MESIINKCIQTGRLPLSGFSEFSTHYSGGILCFLPLIIWIVHPNLPDPDFTFKVAIIGIIAGVFICWIKYRELNFTYIPTNKEKKEILENLKEVAYRNNWYTCFVLEEEIRGIIFYNHHNRIDKPTVRITIIFADKNTLLVNSVIDPLLGKAISTTTLGENKRNIQQIKAIL